MASQLHIHRPERMVRSHSSEPSWEADVHSVWASSIPRYIPSCASQPEPALCTLGTSVSTEAAEDSWRGTLSTTHSTVQGVMCFPCVATAVSAVTALEYVVRGETRISRQQFYFILLFF